MLSQVLTTVLLDAQPWLYPHWVHRCLRPWHHDAGYIAWYAKASHPRIIPPDEGSPPRSVNVEQIIEEKHAREVHDTLTIIRDVVHIADDIVARSGEMTKEEIVQEVMRIASTSRHAFTYQIARQRRGQRHGRQQG